MSIGFGVKLYLGYKFLGYALFMIMADLFVMEIIAGAHTFLYYWNRAQFVVDTEEITITCTLDSAHKICGVYKKRAPVSP